MRYIAGCSGGKDSVAQLILAKEHGEPLDEVVYCEVMFSREISGEVPEHRDFIYQTIKPFVEDVLRVPFVVVRSEKTYLDVFYHIISRGEREGQLYGFAIPGMCAINRDCKIPPIENYWKRQGADVTQYVGIAFDETERLERLRGTNRVSLLEKYGITEIQALRMCRDRGLLSPIYGFTQRNGCWFCPNCKDDEWANLIYKHGELFDMLIDLEQEVESDVAKRLTRRETPTQLKQRILSYGEQLSWFDMQGGMT